MYANKRKSAKIRLCRLTKIYWIFKHLYICMYVCVFIGAYTEFICKNYFDNSRKRNKHACTIRKCTAIKHCQTTSTQLHTSTLTHIHMYIYSRMRVPAFALWHMCSAQPRHPTLGRQAQCRQQGRQWWIANKQTSNMQHNTTQQPKQQ